MSHRSRASRDRVRQHVHCDSCYSRRCRARVEPSVCCAITQCRLHCGAVFHLCKEEDHLLLCPNVRVPCLNAGYGCPLHLPRSARAAHLQACPASVVCCSMEWLRWPTDETDPHGFEALQNNVQQDGDSQGEALDVAMARVDQSDLYSRLKMKPLYPELVEEEVEEEEVEEEELKDEKKEEMAVGEVVSDVPHKDTSEEETSLKTAGKGAAISKEKYDICEMMFSMEKGGCAAAQENLERPPRDEKGRRHGETLPEEEESSAGDSDCPHDTTKMGLAPWQEGVMERLGQELTPQEYNIYMVHHGRMLITFGHIAACTPREKDFVYGSLEPIPVQTLRSFKVPVSYHYRRRVQLYDVASRVPTESRCVDTSDLGVSEDTWFRDEAETTLLGYADMSVMGHKISESKAADGLYVDVGTQTQSFRSAPFKAKTTLAEVMAGRPQKLRLQLQERSVSSRNHRANCVFTFVCGHSFHRREFSTHFRNAHSDIQTCLSGWFEQRCPLAYLGCTYSQKRFQPSTHTATVTYDQHLKCFNLRPTVEPSTGGRKSGGGAEGEEDSLSSLPYEVLCHVAGFLDSLSLSQLALVSRLMRQVCSSQLQDRGMVTLRWERTACTRGGARWTAKPVWEFSRLFSAVDSWHMADVPPISAHLKVCPYYQTFARDEPVPLVRMNEQHSGGQRDPSLVNHFKEKTLKQ
ncbi:F-box only protein 40-like [Cololabis saira]|uniref:F-box only protein 40-like n=1 Tax=Cololabis saira TaxID=129043 RepID=UPI002AD51B73|nr:F-box only protein 40-like [Cololabis saira]